jgi:hypothetical protein
MGIPIFHETDDAGTIHTVGTSQQKSNSTLSDVQPVNFANFAGARTLQNWTCSLSALWSVRVRVREIFLFLFLEVLPVTSSYQILGGGGETFFPFPPTFTCRRPEVCFILNLRSDPNSTWEQELPRNWRDIDFKICSSQEFQLEFLQQRQEKMYFLFDLTSMKLIRWQQTRSRVYIDEI